LGWRYKLQHCNDLVPSLEASQWALKTPLPRVDTYSYHG
jgi:hypothetical protein